MRTRPENEERAAHAESAMEHHAMRTNNDGPDVDPRGALQDIMTDLRHWCKANGHSFDDAVAMSEDHFEAELRGE